MHTELQKRLEAALGGAYSIDRELAAGGMATVFLARERALDRPVVLKVLPERASEVDAERFRREVALAARLQHPNIVPVLAAGEADGLVYYVMPHVDGASLRQRLSSTRGLSISESVRILRDVGRALAYAHEHDVVHRDIKPENVLITGRAAAVTDFGIAKALSSARRVSGGVSGSAEQLTVAGTTVGTLAYMAPEQAVGEAVDHRADIYSFGVMAYELLSGDKPFSGKSAQALVAAHLRDTPAPLLERRPDIPAALADLVMQCLEKRPDQRPQSASDLVDALEVIGPSSGTTATFRRMRRPGRRTMIGGAVAAAAALATLMLAPFRDSGDAVRSLAVLPFVNMSGDPGNDFLGDGISEELIATLSRVPALRVAARTSSFAFKGSNRDMPEVADALHAGAILAGSVRRSGDRLRVSAELTRRADGRVLWRETYDRRVDDVLAVQEEIAGAIVDALEIRLLAEGESGRNVAAARGRVLARRPTSDVTAYELYLRGRFEWGRRKLESLQAALAYYDSAVAKDTAFALAYAGLADAYVVLGNWGYLPTRDAGERSLAAARRAVTLDSTLAEGHASLASVLCTYVWDWPAAERAFRRAIALNPGLATTHYFYSRCLLGHGRVADAVVQAREAMQLDPLNAQITTALMTAMLVTGQIDSAIVLGARALRIDPSNVGARFWLAVAHVRNRDAAKARAVVAPLAPDEQASPLMLSLSGALAAFESDSVAARRVLASLAKRASDNAFSIAMIHAALGERNEAFRWLDRALAERSDGFIVFARVVPWFDGMRQDPRFAAMLARVSGAPAG